MTALHIWITRAHELVRAVGRGLFNLTHNGFALLGIAVVSSVVGLAAQPDLRELGETRLMSWLHERKSEALGMDLDLDATGRATAIDPSDLPKQQADHVKVMLEAGRGLQTLLGPVVGAIVVVTMANQLSAFAEAVLIVQGVVFVVVVMLFRRGIVGEIAHRFGKSL